jgi:hypothetical protein
MSAPHLFDRAALTRHRARATVDVLRRAVMDELQDRMAEVNRSFTSPAIITGWPALWDWPGATIIPDDDHLKLQPAAHDLIIHDMALHWANDPVGQLIQSRLALKPDGLFLGTLFGGQTLHELRAALAQAEIDVTGGLSPRVAPMGEIRDLGALLQRAGFALPVADATPFTLTYLNACSLMRDLRAMGETNALTGRLRHPTRRAVMTRVADIYHAAWATPDGRIPATFEVVTLTGWAPSAEQPQPLRPGSARARLADALRVPEQPLRRSGD